MAMIRIGSGRPGLKAKLIIGLVLLMMAAAGTLMALLAIGMFLFMVPVIVVVSIVYALLPKRKTAPAPGRANPPDVLEGQFRVVGRSSDKSGAGHITRD
jgi:membrane protein implicated in regulation of membrane protease activity